MDTFVYIDNYRGFKNACIPLTQVNFLVGENSTGKTSFLELLEILGHAPFWFFEPKFAVPGATPRHFLDLVSAESLSRTTFCIGSIGSSSRDAGDLCGMLVTYVNVDGRASPSRISMIQDEIVRTVDGQLWSAKKGIRYRVRTKTYSAKKDGPLTVRGLVSLHKSNVGFSQFDLADERRAGPLLMRFDRQLFDGKDFVEREMKAPYPFMSNFIDVAPIRSKPRRTYDAPQTEFTSDGQHTPYVIKKRLSSKTQAMAFTEFLTNAGASSGLFKLIKIKTYGTGVRAPFEMQVVLDRTPLGLDHVGYGVSQSLPVLVEIFVRPKRTAFMIQQPEVHLHPRAQATFGDLIAELSRIDEKRFVVETHSDFMIDRFRLNVRKEGLIPSQLLFFERKNAGNIVTAIPVLEGGELPSDQPAAYRDFFFNESLALLS